MLRKLASPGPPAHSPSRPNVAARPQAPPTRDCGSESSRLIKEPPDQALSCTESAMPLPDQVSVTLEGVNVTVTSVKAAVLALSAVSDTPTPSRSTSRAAPLQSGRTSISGAVSAPLAATEPTNDIP